MIQTLSIRTKLIVAMLALVASVALMGVTADAANAAGVTEIRWVENHTPYFVYVENHETKERKLVSPYTAMSVNQRVPWATDETEFNRGHYIELGFSLTSPLPRFTIWQEDHNRQPYPGDKIRYTSACSECGYGWHPHYRPDAKPMDGASHTGGRRILSITYKAPRPGWPGYMPTMYAQLR